MKTHGLILLSALLVAALMLHGQEAAPPSVDLFPEQEEEEPSPTPPPPNGPELPELKQLDDSFKRKSLGTDADALPVHVLWRELKTAPSTIRRCRRQRNTRRPPERIW